MKRIFAFLLVLTLAFSLCACGQKAPETPETTLPTETEPPVDPTYEFEVGFTVTMPAGFAEKESMLNDFFGAAADGSYSIIANKDPKVQYENVEAFATALAKANGQEAPEQDENGNYFVSYSNEKNGQHFYTAVREGETYIYRIAFYCPEENWTEFEAVFPQWAATITVK